MALLGIQLYHALRSRIEFGDTAVRIALPQGSGATPMLRFVDREVPYDRIQAVETRCVLFGRTLAPVLMRATRLLTRDGEHIHLGNVNEDDVDEALPFPEIGRRLAERAGCEVVDGGMVRRSIERRVLGLIGRKTAIEESPPLTEEEKAEIGTRHARAMRCLIVAMAVLVVGGIAIDVFTAPRTTFTTAGGSPPPASKK
jgi:hypothetical protein